MNDQIPIFEPMPIEKEKNIILDAIADLLAENGLSGLTARFRKLTGKGSAESYSVTFSGKRIVRIYCGQEVTFLEFPNIGELGGDCTGKNIRVDIDSLRDIPDHIDKIKLSCQYILDRLPKEFSCCSRYMECSDAKICIHPDKTAALGCFYRKVLHSGRVFYGENRNID